MAEAPLSNYPEKRPIGQVETARLVFRAGDRVRDGILELVRDDVRERIGQRALFLSSNFARSVVRLDGVLEGDDAQLESAVSRVIKVGDATTKKQLLARYATLKAGKRPDGEAVVALQLGIVLNPRVRELLQENPSVPSDLVHGRTLPVRTIIPKRALIDQAEYLQTSESLNQLLYGTTEVSDDMNFQRPAEDTINAYVTGMNMTFKPLRRPPKNR